MAAPGPGGALWSRAAALVAEREAVLADAAAAWIGFARVQGWSRSDVECLWDGLTEDLVRRSARKRGAPTTEVRGEVLAVMTALRERILEGLARPEEA